MMLADVCGFAVAVAGGALDNRLPGHIPANFYERSPYHGQPRPTCVCFFCSERETRSFAKEAVLTNYF